MDFWLDKEDVKVIFSEVGALLGIIGLSLAVPIFVAQHYGEGEMARIFLWMLVLFAGPGMLMHRRLKTDRQLMLKHAAIVATIAWLIIPLMSVLPFVFNGISLPDSLFETMSGWTATGLSMMPHPESLPRSLIFWRSYMQWVGGMGIITLALSILRNPGALKLYTSEGRNENLKLSITGTARSMWAIYLMYTIAGIGLVRISGMPLFESINHVMSAISTGGFSVTAASISGYNDGVKLALSLVMLFGGMSFVLHYDMLRGRAREALRSTEFHLYLAVILLASLLIWSNMQANAGPVDVLFQTISSVTGTGFTSVDLGAWSEFSLFILVLLMLFGPCAGSTGGALKMWRVLLVFKSVYRELMRHLVPSSAVMQIKVNRTIIDEKDLVKILCFVLLYLGLVVSGGLLLMWFGYGAFESMFLAASAQGNVGIATLAPDKWFAMGTGPKTVLMALMWAGRIEIFPVLTLIRALIPRRD